jgi:hypothetical protein
MNLPRTTNYRHWIVFAATFCMLLIWGAGPAMAFQPQPEPPGVFMPTLTPEDALRVNVAYVTKNKIKSARCLIFIRSLLSGEVLMEKEVVLESGKGMSIDVSYEELLKIGVDGSQLVGHRNDLPLRVQIKADQRKNIFVGFEIHDALYTPTRTYITGGAEPLD